MRGACFAFCSAGETVPKLRKEVHSRFVTPASRRQSSTLQFLFAGGDAGVTKSFGTVSGVSPAMSMFTGPLGELQQYLTGPPSRQQKILGYIGGGFSLTVGIFLIIQIILSVLLYR